MLRLLQRLAACFLDEPIRIPYCLDVLGLGTCTGTEITSTRNSPQIFHFHSTHLHLVSVSSSTIHAELPFHPPPFPAIFSKPILFHFYYSVANWWKWTVTKNNVKLAANRLNDSIFDALSCNMKIKQCHIAAVIPQKFFSSRRGHRDVCFRLHGNPTTLPFVPAVFLSSHPRAD